MKKIRIAFSAFFILSIVLALLFWSRYRHVVVDPLSYVHQNDIIAASERLMLDIRRENVLAESSERKLREVMKKLRDGWSGFIVDEYYPFRYESQDLLNSIYWKLGYYATSSSPATREKLISLLREIPPNPDNSKKVEYYESLFREFDFKR